MDQVRILYGYGEFDLERRDSFDSIKRRNLRVTVWVTDNTRYESPLRSSPTSSLRTSTVHRCLDTARNCGRTMLPPCSRVLRFAVRTALPTLSDIVETIEKVYQYHGIELSRIDRYFVVQLTVVWCSLSTETTLKYYQIFCRKRKKDFIRVWCSFENFKYLNSCRFYNSWMKFQFAIENDPTEVQCDFSRVLSDVALWRIYWVPRTRIQRMQEVYRRNWTHFQNCSWVIRKEYPRLTNLPRHNKRYIINNHHNRLHQQLLFPRTCNQTPLGTARCFQSAFHLSQIES